MNNPCGLVDKANIVLLERSECTGKTIYLRTAVLNWLIVTAINGSSTDKHFHAEPILLLTAALAGAMVQKQKPVLVEVKRHISVLYKPTGITTPAGYVAGTEQDGAQYF